MPLLSKSAEPHLWENTVPVLCAFPSAHRDRAKIDTSVQTSLSAPPDSTNRFGNLCLVALCV